MIKGKLRYKLLHIFAVFALSIIFGCGRAVEKLEKIGDRDAPRSTPVSGLLPLGNPSGATDDGRDRTNYLLTRGSYAASYNDRRGTLNWISWRITSGDLGEALPRAEFRPDPLLPPGFNTILPSDYSRSGYDRGHMVASADRFADPALNEETFYMTNIVPQTKALNQFPWQKFESYTRTLARKGYDVYATAGVLGEKGRLKNRVTVPAACWKILYAVPAGVSPLDSSAAHVIAVEMPNIDGIDHQRWNAFKTTVRALEQRTGYNFLSALPPEEQERLETTTQFEPPR
jgi:endonuclease G